MFRRALRLVPALALAALLLPGVARAGDEYCDVDPAVVVTTPAGNTVVVYVTNGGPVSHVAELAAATLSYAAEPHAGGTQTKVTIYDTVADYDGHAHSVLGYASSGPNRTGTIYDQVTGTAGTTMALRFILDIP